MGRIIALANQKGGVGKTTTTINLGAYLANQSKRILVIDIDPQGNAGSGLGLDVNSIQTNLYHALLEETPIARVVQKTSVDNLEVIPSNIDLSGLEVDLREDGARDYQLQKVLPEIADDYDFILVDCPPSLGLLTINALVSAHSVMIPLQCEYFALEGLTQLLRIIRMVQNRLNTTLELEGVLLTMFDSRTKLSSAVVSDVREHFGNEVFDVIVPRNVRLSEAPSYGEPIGIYDPNSSGAVAYKKLAKEFLNRLSQAKAS